MNANEMDLTLLANLFLEPLCQLADAAAMCWEPRPSSQVFRAMEAEIAAREAASKITALVRRHLAPATEKLERDARLGRELVALLQEHAGETGESEGAVEVLQRIIAGAETAKRIAACDHPRRKTMLEDGRTDCRDCGVSITPLFWAAEKDLRSQGAVEIVVRIDAAPVRLPLAMGKSTRSRLLDIRALAEERARAEAGGAGAASTEIEPTRPPEGEERPVPATEAPTPDEQPWPDDEDLLT